MRWQWLPISCFVLFLAVAGCKNSKPNLKPEEGPPAYILPPNDRRYSEFIQYPKDTLHQDPIRRRQKQMDTMPTKLGPTGSAGGPRLGGL